MRGGVSSGCVVYLVLRGNVLSAKCSNEEEIIHIRFFFLGKPRTTRYNILEVGIGC